MGNGASLADTYSPGKANFDPSASLSSVASINSNGGETEFRNVGAQLQQTMVKTGELLWRAAPGVSLEWVSINQFDGNY